jgi:4-methyl-5(b-hydroxyethyl)-thiazole monophosphate biosynthesis
MDQPAVIDGNIVTGRGMGAAVPFGLAILEKLQGRKAAEAMAEKIVYR